MLIWVFCLWSHSLRFGKNYGENLPQKDGVENGLRFFYEAKSRAGFLLLQRKRSKKNGVKTDKIMGEAESR